jgi:hypothetical protein
MESLIAVQEALKDERQIRRAVRRARSQEEAAKRAKAELPDVTGARDDVGPSEELELTANSVRPDGRYIVQPDGSVVGLPNDAPLRALARTGLVTLSPDGKPMVDPELTETVEELIRALK